LPPLSCRLGWMLYRLGCAAWVDAWPPLCSEFLCILDVGVSCSWLRCLVESRFVGSCEFFSPLFFMFMLGSSSTCLVMLYNHLNSLCLLRFVLVLLLSS
jgi:hypothetical protein